MTRTFFSCAAVFYCLTAMATTPPALTSSDWFTRAWQTENGLPNNNVNSLAQTSDGFIWIATSHGLARFDGVNFDEISSTNFIGGANQGAMAVKKNHSGGLWVAMDRGAVVNLNPDKSEAVMPATNGLPDLIAHTLVETDDGALWISYVGGAISFLENGKATSVTPQQGLPWAGISSVAKDSKGQIWLARAGEVGIFRDGQFNSLVRVSNHAIQLAAAHAGGIWICAGSHLFHFAEGGTLKEFGEIESGNSRVEPSAVFEDSRGAVWVGTAYDGLFRFNGVDFKKISTSHPEISSLLEDREGNIWVGTHGGGLNRLRRTTITLEDAENGLPSEAVQSVCEDAGGTLWAVTGNGALVCRNTNGWNIISTNADWPANTPTCVAATSDGSVWIGTRNHRLIRRRNGKFEVWGKSAGVTASPISVLTFSSNGDLWIGGFNHEVEIFRGGKFYNVPLPEDARSIRAIVQDTAGEIWIGTSKGYLFRVNGTNAVDETIKISSTLRSIRTLYAATDGSLWLGYAGAGLGRLKDGHFTRITDTQGLFDNYISQIVPDDRGWIWFGADRGIFKVRAQELDNAMDNSAIHVRSIHYGRGEGLPSLQADFGFMPGAIRSRDGRIWIPTRSALAIANPENHVINPQPPPVLLKRIAVDEKTVAAYGGIMPVRKVMDLRKPIALQLSPDHRKLEFDFAALSFSAPENVRLQYKLEGFDSDWIEANAQRNAIYPRLPAGNYYFRVRACNSDGIWNDMGANFSFVVTPFIWQRWWFQTLGLFLFAAITIVSVRYVSFQRLRARLRALEAQAALDKERARIARDLHDDLGSHLTKIVLLSDLISDFRTEPEKSGETAKQVSSAARQVIKSLDETVWAVNPRNDTLPHLINYISQFAVEFLRMAGIRCHADLPLRVPEKNVSTEVRHNLFLVVKEALNNVVNHANASEVSLRISVEEKSICLMLEDNGRGFDHTPDNGCADGLRNMRQRIEELGGEFNLESKCASGTRLAIITPLTHHK